MSNRTAILFDLDDTLFDHSNSVARSIETLRSENALLHTRSLAGILAEHRRLLDLMHGDVLAGRLSPQQARVDRMRGIFRFCGAEPAEELLVAAAALHRERYRSAWQAVPGALELLAQLGSHARIAIVTNNLTEEQRTKLEVCGFAPFVDTLVTSEESGCAKPDPEIFRIALRRLDCRADEAVMVGDSWDIDMVGARNAAIRGIWFNRYGMAAPPGSAVEEISSLPDLPGKLGIPLGLPRG